MSRLADDMATEVARMDRLAYGYRQCKEYDLMTACDLAAHALRQAIRRMREVEVERANAREREDA